MFDQATDYALAQRRRRRRQGDYFNNPVLWAKERAGIHLWGKQAEIAMSVAENHDNVVKAGHGVGKSLLAAVLICWWVDTRWPDGRVASTAPSSHQIGAIVWYEVRNIYRAVNKRYEEGDTFATMPGYITSDNIWKTEDGDMVGFGRKPPDHKVDDAFQGIHSRSGYVLAIGDEAVGLTEEMVDSLGNITSTGDSRRLLICNPTNPASYVGKIFKEDFANWTKHTISVFDNPNFTGEEVPDNFPLEALSDQSFVDSKKAEYGEGTPRYISRILGEFAFDNDFSLIRVEDLARAHDTDIRPSGDQPVLGVDVARFGDDLSVVYSNDNGLVRFVESWSGVDGMTTAEKIHQIALRTTAREVRIDATGLGGPIKDRVVQIRNNDGATYDIVEMIGSQRAIDPVQHHNARAQWWDGLRYDLKAGLIDVDPSDSVLEDELLAVQYKFSARNALLIESKDDMRKKGRKSPDFADAMVYAAADMTYLEQPPTGKQFVDSDEFSGEDDYGDSVLNALQW